MYRLVSNFDWTYFISIKSPMQLNLLRAHNDTLTY